MPGLDYALSKTEKLSSADELERVLLSGVVNREAVSIVAAPESNQIVLRSPPMATRRSPASPHIPAPS